MKLAFLCLLTLPFSTFGDVKSQWPCPELSSETFYKIAKCTCNVPDHPHNDRDIKCDGGVFKPGRSSVFKRTYFPINKILKLSILNSSPLYLEKDFFLSITVTSLEILNTPILLMHDEVFKKQMWSLMTINLGDNNLEYFPFHELRNLKELTHLTIKNNKLTHIPNKLGRLHLLRNIRLNDNRIETISPMAFMKIPKLELIELSGNRIKRFNRLTLAMSHDLDKPGKRLSITTKNNELVDTHFNTFTSGEFCVLQPHLIFCSYHKIRVGQTIRYNFLTT